MAKVTINYKPPVPVKPEIESVILELTSDEAQYLKIYLGHTYYSIRKHHMRGATNSEVFNKFYPENGDCKDIGAQLYHALSRELGSDQN